MPKDFVSTIHTLVELCRDATETPREQGAYFERIIKKYLQEVEPYATKLSSIWLWSEWPDRWGGDTGIDIVARETATGAFWAIQCKCYDSNHSIGKPDIDSFISASGKSFSNIEGTHHFSHRLVISTTDKWNSNAEDAIKGQSIPVKRLGLKDLAESPVYWDEIEHSLRARLGLGQPTKLAEGVTSFNETWVPNIPLKTKKLLREHQEEAVNAVINRFSSSDRGQM